MSTSLVLLDWLREQCRDYRFDVRGVFHRLGTNSQWPLKAADAEELEEALRLNGHLLPLPKEPAALANIIEVSIADFLQTRLGLVEGASVRRGTERGYPDLEVSGSTFGGFYAVDIKVARRNKAKTQTQSRITLYTGNTYFRWPTLPWPGTFRPFNAYNSHVDVLVIYTLDEAASCRATEIEVLVQEAWRIGSRDRSSTTREYIGAVTSLDALRAGRGAFSTAQEFYDYWRKYPFRISAQIQKELQRIIDRLDESGADRLIRE